MEKAAGAADLRRREGGGARGTPWKEEEESKKEGLWRLVARVEAMEEAIEAEQNRGDFWEWG